MPSDSDKTASFKRADLRLPTLVKNVPVVVVVEGSSIGMEVRLDRDVAIIGRAENADVSVDDRLVSREHARIEAVVEGDSCRYYLLDNGSTNATFLNNQPVQRSPLSEGDKIRIGGTVLRFSYHDEVDAEYHRRIFDLITYDELSGLLTLRPFYRELERELQRSERLGLPFGLLMMDVDHFKQVNDTYGHQTGSYVLKEIGRLIRQALRYNDAAARYGGEEFIAYLPNCDLEAALNGAEKVRDSVESFAFDYKGNRPKVTISIGVAAFPFDAKEVDELVRKADEALYRAKDLGRNRVIAAADPAGSTPPAQPREGVT